MLELLIVNSQSAPDCWI